MNNLQQKQSENSIDELIRKIITLENFNKSLLKKICILKTKLIDQQQNHNQNQLRSKL